MLRKIVFTTAPMLGAAVVTVSKDNNKEKEPVKLRPSELPLYNPLVEDKKKCTSCKHADQNKPTGGVRGNIEEGIGFVRGNVTQVYNSVSSQTHKVDDFYQTGKEHSKGSKNNLKAQWNVNLNLFFFFSIIGIFK